MRELLFVEALSDRIQVLRDGFPVAIFRGQGNTIEAAQDEALEMARLFVEVWEDDHPLMPNPCPFCGTAGLGIKPPGLTLENNADGNQWIVCQVCGATGPIGESRQKCVAMWNGTLKESEVEGCPTHQEHGK